VASSRERTPGWRVLVGLVTPLLLILARYRVHNPERIPATGAFILAPNHVTNFDPLVTAYALWHSGRVPRFLAKAGLFRVPVLGALLRGTGQIPVERASASGGGDPLAAAGKLVDDGLAIIVYPEGTLTRDPDLWPMRGKYGAVRLALEHGIPIIPCAHWGAQAVLPRYSKRLSVFPRKDIDIVFGEPVDLSRWADAPRTGATYAAATTELMNAITGLLEGLRGEKAPAKRWDPAQHGQSEIGRFDPPA
jgi:1-acyl-sn-glycerol-3-phosphate acyltransferase